MIGEKLGVKKEDVPRLFAAVTFCTSTLIEQKSLTASVFVNTGVSLGLIAEEDKEHVGRFMDAVLSNREPVANMAERARVASTLLPRLTTFSTTIDLRPAFNDDGTAIKFSVPVIIAHVENDSTDDVWVQMSKTQVERLITDLQEVLERVGVVEKWAEEKPLAGTLMP